MTRPRPWNTATRAAGTTQAEVCGLRLHPECAEAQSKDIGVIATERAGTSMCVATAVCGRATPTCLPRISTEQTLIRYIDRLLMFYVRTGDRLQRTSVWMENMEGA